MSFSYFSFKRSFDFFFASLILVLLSPFLLLVSLLILVDLGWPVFFIQRRTGKNLSTFNMIKFRTMRSISILDLSRDDRIRITFIGNLLRSLSVDELPSLVNVVLGHMSIVGPRPLLSSYTIKMTDLELERFKVQPGLTGLVQVSGRNKLSWDQKFHLDRQYVKSVCFFVDFLIILRTIPAIFDFKSVNQSSSSTMISFLDK